MKKKKFLVVISLLLFLLASNAMALPFNDRNPAVIAGLGNLQAFLAEEYPTQGFNVSSDQNPSAIFQPSVTGRTSSSFMLLLENTTAASENIFGIYSFSDPSLKLQIFGGDNSENYSAAVSFFKGSVQIGNTKIDNFGTAFGFYITTPSATFYSEDDKNSGYAQMLMYQFKTSGLGHEWIVAIEDSAYDSSSDFDDMVVKASEIKPVPEPVSMLLFGSGLVGVGGYVRRRFKK